MRDDFTRVMVLESLVQELQGKLARSTFENDELRKTNKVLLAQLQDLQYAQAHYDEAVDDLESEIAKLRNDVVDLELEKKDTEDENGDLQSEVYSLEATIRDLENEVKALQEKLDAKE